jgi:hypothetical protein
VSGGIELSRINQLIFYRTDIIALFPFHVSLYIPRPLWSAFLNTLSVLRIRDRSDDGPQDRPKTSFRQLKFPMNFVTAPLIADLFLLAISAITRVEVKAGTLGADNISPINIMVFFLSLAYIAIRYVHLKYSGLLETCMLIN